MSLDDYIDYLKDQADAAEDEADELEELRAENTRLRKALLTIMEDDEQHSHPCGPKVYGHFGNIAKKALEGES